MTNELFFFSYNVFAQPYLTYGFVDPSGNLKRYEKKVRRESGKATKSRKKKKEENKREKIERVERKDERKNRRNRRASEGKMRNQREKR